jgi:hypothetical protein
MRFDFDNTLAACPDRLDGLELGQAT